MSGDKKIPKTITEVNREMLRCRQDINDKLEEGAERMDALQGNMEEMRGDINEISLAVQELVEIWRAGKGFIRVVGWVGKSIKWTVGVGIAVGALWMFLRTGHFPGGNHK